MSLNVEKKRRIYNKKSVLKKIYQEWYSQIKKYLKNGKTIEIGSGIGVAKKHIDCVTTDIEKNDYIDRKEDACEMTFGDESVNNIIGIDILHHLNDIDAFFSEARRILIPGGRIIFIEPYISKFSFILRKLFHHEDLSFKKTTKTGNDPHESNLALPTVLFEKELSSFLKKFSSFKIIEIKKQDILAYPLSCGYKSISLLPKFLISPIFYLDKKLSKSKFIKNTFAFKMLIVLEKKNKY